ncbi:MAG TPA: hypothetical protein VF510_01490, partial [Ktedonobacterales bacterium]
RTSGPLPPGNSSGTNRIPGASYQDQTWTSAFNLPNLTNSPSNPSGQGEANGERPDVPRSATETRVLPPSDKWKQE